MWHTSWCEKHCQIDNIDNVSTPTLGLHNMYILKKSFVVRDVKPPYILPLGCVMCDTLCMDTILSSSWWKLIGDNLFCIQWCCLLIWDWALTWISAWVLLAYSSTKLSHGVALRSHQHQYQCLDTWAPDIVCYQVSIKWISSAGIGAGTKRGLEPRHGFEPGYFWHSQPKCPTVSPWDPTSRRAWPPGRQTFSHI